MDQDKLTPLERRVLAMQEEGLDTAEIAKRIKASPRHVERILRWIEIPRDRRPGSRRDGPLTPIERRVLAMRSQGLDHDEIAERFRRGPRFIRQVEALGHLRKGWALLG